MAHSVHSSEGSITRGRTLDHAAAVYDFLAPLMTFGLEDRISNRIIDQMALPVSAHVLDVGCGTGTLSIRIARRLSNDPNSFVNGLDAASKMLDVARQKARGLSNIQFDHAAAEALPYSDNSFDAVLSTFFFHHIDYELKTKTLAEVYRTLKPEGKFVIVDVDQPTNIFGAFCAWSGYWLFQQNEIRENIEGRLQQAIAESPFSRWEKTAHHLGYVGVYELVK